jgi:hypothetical protein
MFYVEPDGTITGLGHLPPRDYYLATEALDMSRLYATVTGATRHPGAADATAITIEGPTAYFDGQQFMDNDWSTRGLEPIGYYHTIKIGD